MKPEHFDQVNLVLGKPDSLTDKECTSLPTYRGEDYCLSRWEPSEEERQSILSGEGVWVYVYAPRNSQPPIAVTALNPFKEKKDADESIN